MVFSTSGQILLFDIVHISGASSPRHIFQQLSRRNSGGGRNGISSVGSSRTTGATKTAWFCEGRPSGIGGNIRPRAKCRRGLVELFAHRDVRELCQNLHDRIHQSRSRKSFGDSGLLLNRALPCVLVSTVCISILIKGVG